MLLYFLYFILLFFFFLGPPLWHMEVPRQGSNQSCSCQPMPQPQPRQIWAEFGTYAAAYGNVGSLTHWARPGIKHTSSWILVGFLTPWATMGTPKLTTSILWKTLSRQLEDISETGLLSKIYKELLKLNHQKYHNPILKWTKDLGVPVVMQQKRIRLGIMRSRVRSLASLSRLRIWRCCELWHRPQTRLGSGVAAAVV